jgi:hypothetical protein
MQSREIDEGVGVLCNSNTAETCMSAAFIYTEGREVSKSFETKWLGSRTSDRLGYRSTSDFGKDEVEGEKDEVSRRRQATVRGAK